MSSLKIFSTNAMRSAMAELITTFERTSGHTLSIGWSTTNQTLTRIQEGETADMVIATGPGIADQLQPKFRVIPGGLVGELVVRGEAELGVQMLPEIFAVKGFELVGPFPPELQQVNSFATAILSGTQRADTAQAFIQFLTTPAAVNALKTGGFTTL